MNEKYMKLAFKEAKKAFDKGEVPVGAVIVKNDKIISCSYNNKESNNSIISHAEINAIIEAENIFDNWRLIDCDIYVTLDPCPMCASAIKQCRIKNVYSAMKNNDVNNYDIISNIFNYSDGVNNRVNFVTNLDVDTSSKLLSSFFAKRRK